MSDAPQRPPEAATGEDRSGIRYFRLTNLAISNRVSVLVLVFITALVGMLAYRSIPKESSPEITIPMIAVSTVYPGVSPTDMETLVTRVIEDELNTIPEVVELTSVSVQGYSNVTVEFDSDMDMEAALQKVREKVDLARPDLPSDAEEPVLSEFNFSEFPIMQVNISGEYDLVRLKEIAEDLQDRLEQVPSILSVGLSGGLEREVKVEVDLARLKFYAVAFEDVIAAIRAENVTVPGGAIEVGSQEFLVRVDGEFADPAVIEDIVITTKAGQPVYIRDVASVDFGFKDRSSYARLDGSAVVTLDIVKRSGENIIETSDAVKRVVEEATPTFPPTTVVKITSDQSEDIHDMVLSLENNIISGLVLVVAVLLFFLGVRNAAFVGISIPLSMLLSFMILKALGVTMNMVVLFSLILALGMLVDNAIVVVENIYRHRERGFDPFEAARRGTGEVAMPIISSTATTVAAFSPLLFWPGIVGEFMSFLPLTLIVALSSSLFVALVMVPTVCAMFMRVDGAPHQPMRPAARWGLLAASALLLLLVAGSSPLAALTMGATAAGLVVLHRLLLARVARAFQDRTVPAIIERYSRALQWSLRHRGLTLAACAVAFVATIIVFAGNNAGVEYFPENIPPSSVYARIDVPAGTSPEFTDGMVRRVERQMQDIAGIEDAESRVATVRSSSGGGGIFETADEGTVAVGFVDYNQRRHDTFETLRNLQQAIGSGIAGGEIRVEKPQNGPPSGPPINLEIVGPDVDQLRVLSDRALAVLKTAPVYSRLVGLSSDMARGRPELVVEVDRETAALYDLTTTEVGMTVRTAIQGTEAAKFRAGRDEYDIMVRLAEDYRAELDALRDLTIVSDDRQIPLSSLARWHVDEGLGEVRRKNLDRVATISSDVRSGEQSNAVLADVQATLADFEQSLPPGYSIRYTGQQEDQAEAQAFLSGAFLIALLLIAFILMSQFNSVMKPLIIMTSVIMSTVGVLIGLMLFRMPFGIIMTGVGVISLAGVVVNNAIVLIDYTDLLRKRDGLDRIAAVMTAGKTRFRPVILTAVTTVLGLVPLAIGFNVDFFGLFTALNPDIYWGGEQAAWWAPMAIAVIAGLSFATVLTLIVVPVVYTVVDDMALFFQRHFTQAGAATADVAAPGSALPGRRRRLVAALSRFQRQRPGELARSDGD
jgi:multidrug efflux pump subunit AcrB